MSGVLLVFGLALVVATSVRSRASFALLGAFMAFLFVPALMERPPNSARLVTTAPLATLLVALGLVRTVELLIPARQVVAGLAMGAVTASLVGLGIRAPELASRC